MTVDSIIQQILASRRDLRREEILRMIEEKVRSAKGYFTDEAAARIVASELGVKTPRKRLPEMLVKNLVSGLNDVTVTGRIVYVSPSQRFTRSDEIEGLVKRLLIADKSGMIKVVLWNDKAKRADELDMRPGQIVRLLHGYVREGFDGRLELNLGRRGEIELSAQERIQDNYPPLEAFLKKIGDITERDRNVNVSGVIQEVSPESRFTRKDGSEGKVRSVWLRDSTGEIRSVFWNSKADEIKGLRKGNSLKIMNAEVRSRMGGQLELHIGRKSIIEVSTQRTRGKIDAPA
ncbi:MAG: OB-fold nucleic acid binding domain-containing protein [Candidatus Bathyarchaeia archaeon]